MKTMQKWHLEGEVRYEASAGSTLGLLPIFTPVDDACSPASVSQLHLH